MKIKMGTTVVVRYHVGEVKIEIEKIKERRKIIKKGRKLSRGCFGKIHV
jgi:ribosomal 50S subunit-recycling heat shock protein